LKKPEIYIISFKNNFKMVRTDDLQVFVFSSDLGSLSAAARELDITPAVASVAVKRLEAALGTSLLVRSTRSLRLTPAGADYLEYAKKALEALKAGSDAIAHEDKQIKGELSITMPSDLGRNFLLEWLKDFQEQHEQLTLKIKIGDSLIDLYREPVDVAIRYGIPEDSSLIALPLVENNRRILCAAPAYLNRRGEPSKPQDLKHHNCLCFMLGDAIADRWRFYGGSKEMIVKVSGSLTSNDGSSVRQWALWGAGIIYKSGLDVQEDLKAGRLLALLKDYQKEKAPLYCPPISLAIIALRDYLRARFSALSVTQS
jgi:DNA-binding transcriptional LysR family regulator